MALESERSEAAVDLTARAKVDVVESFRRALAAAGIDVAHPIMDGQWHRVALPNDKPGAKSGAYRAFMDGWPAGTIKNWRTGVAIRWKADADPSWSREELARRAKETRRRQAERQEETISVQRAAARKAAWLWERGVEPQAHAYLLRKQVRNHGLRMTERGDLMVPLRDEQGAISTLQFIRPDGSKLFWPGGRVHGSFCAIGDVEGAKQVLVCEGYATGASLHEATGAAVAVSGTATNLAGAAQTVRKLNPRADIIVAADNDHSKDVNVGVRYASGAATLVGGRMIMPRSEMLLPSESDFNDLAVRGGLSLLREELRKSGVHVQPRNGVRRGLAV